MTVTTDRVKVDGGELEVQVTGSGEPLVMVHGSHIADALRPLAAEPVVRDHYRVIRYHRRGLGGSSKAQPGMPIEAHANDCREVLDHVGIPRAHVVGHSYGGVIALQFTSDTPDRVSSLALFEPALMAVPSGPEFFEVVGPAIEAYVAGNGPLAVDRFMSVVGGPGWRTLVEATVPGGPGQAERDAATFFEVELPALEGWEFGADQAAAIDHPVLSVVGTESGPTFLEGRDLLHGWLRGVEDADLPGANHLLQMVDPAGAAEILTGFVAAHPLPTA